MGKTKYRTANLIIQTILEGILRADQNHILVQHGIVKAHLIEYCELKSTTAEKYFEKMENAGYISQHEEPWGQRTISIYEITDKGRQRYEWFVKINSELEDDI